MFTQVYFHKTRVAYDHHIRKALKTLLPNGQFPHPTSTGIKEYLKWDDWRVLGLLAEGQGEEHGQRIANRNHYREVHHTPESPTKKDNAALAKIRTALGTLVDAEESSSTSAYKLDISDDIVVVTEDRLRRVRPLSYYSPIVRNLNKFPLKIVRLYSRRENADRARELIASNAQRKIRS